MNIQMKEKTPTRHDTENETKKKLDVHAILKKAPSFIKKLLLLCIFLLIFLLLREVLDFFFSLLVSYFGE